MPPRRTSYRNRVGKALEIIYNACNRKIIYTPDIQLSKELNMFDVTFLSIGNMMGISTFILIGRNAVSIGPALLITNIFTACVILMSALCYADLIRSDSSSGGAYACSYHHMGELHATMMGCFLSMERISVTALAARGLSSTLDDFSGNRISIALKNYMEFTSVFFGWYPDVVAFVISIASLALVSFNVKTVTTINNTCCLLNLGMFLLITLVFGSNLDFRNWRLPPSTYCGKGGFFPYGIGMVFQGMTRVYSSYIGFDAAGHAGPEVRDPERVIPLSLIVSVIMIGVLYTLYVFTYTLVWSYCDQEVDDPIPYMMKKTGMDVMNWITSVMLPLGMLGKCLASKTIPNNPPRRLNRSWPRDLLPEE